MIIAIDPSLTRTSVVWGSSRTEYFVQSLSSSPRGGSVRQRISRYDDLVSRVMSVIERIEDVDTIFLEGYAYGAKHSREALGEFGGILRWHLVDVADVIEVPPSCLKKFAANNGNAPKNMLAAHLARRYGVMLDNDDEFDAFGLYQLGLVAMKLENADTQWQAAAAEQVMQPGTAKQRKKQQAKKPETKVGNQPQELPF